MDSTFGVSMDSDLTLGTGGDRPTADQERAGTCTGATAAVVDVVAAAPVVAFFFFGSVFTLTLVSVASCALAPLPPSALPAFTGSD